MFAAAGAQSTKKVVPRVFEVAAIAYWDFDGQLKSEERSRGSPESESQKWMLDIRNYTVKIMEYSDRVYVTLSIRPFNGVAFQGGIRHYVLNEKTGEILEQTGEK